MSESVNGRLPGEAAEAVAGAMPKAPPLDLENSSSEKANWLAILGFVLSLFSMPLYMTLTAVSWVSFLSAVTERVGDAELKPTEAELQIIVSGGVTAWIAGTIVAVVALALSLIALVAAVSARKKGGTGRGRKLSIAGIAVSGGILLFAMVNSVSTFGAASNLDNILRSYNTSSASSAHSPEATSAD